MEKVVVGLGNPGARYEQTRHNVGWMVLDRLSERAGTTGRARSRDAAASVRARLGGAELLLVKPTTYMNLSGTAVRAVLARERVPIRDVLVVVDDIALPLGRLRLRERGSDGGHNGLRSIIGEMGTQSFARLRFGIGQPSRGAVEHVLTTFEPGERELLDLVLEAAADCVVDWARLGSARAADRWNGWRPPGTGDEPARGVGGTGEAIVAEVAGAEAAAAGPSAEAATAGPSASVADADGVSRTRTGWRRLLPELRGRTRGGEDR